MKILLTKPFNIQHIFLDKIIAIWGYLFPKDELMVIKNASYETHGELLVHIWSQYIRYGDPDFYILSEADFIPHCDLKKYIEGPTWSDKRLFCSPFYTRPLEQKTYTELPPLKNHFPEMAPWFIALDLRSRPQKWPPSNWLCAAGPHNDAAANGIKHAIEAAWSISCCHAEEINQSALLYYPQIGTHCFFARHFDDPLDTKLYGPSVPYTLKDHLDHVERLLNVG